MVVGLIALLPNRHSKNNLIVDIPHYEIVLNRFNIVTIYDEASVILQQFTRVHRLLFFTFLFVRSFIYCIMTGIAYETVVGEKGKPISL